MSVLWEKLKHIPPGSLVIAESKDAQRILEACSRENRLLPFRLKHPHYFSPWYAEDLPLFLKQKFAHGMAKALKLLPALPFVNENNATFSANAKAAYELKRQLITAKKADFSRCEEIINSKVYFVNREPFLPNTLQGTLLLLDDPAASDCERYPCSDNADQCEFAFAWAVAKLRDGVNPDEIIFLNATAKDEYQLRKRFAYAKVPFMSGSNVRLCQHPVAIDFDNKAKIIGLEAAKAGLHTEDDDPLTNRIARELISIVNKYGIDVLREHQDILEYEIRNSSIRPPYASNTVTTSTLADYAPETGKHYLLINANSSMFEFGYAVEYFSESELEALKMEKPTETQRRFQRDSTRKLAATANLTIAYCLVDEGQETQACELQLDRNIIDKSRNREAFAYSYSADLELLKYAKMRYQRDTYGMTAADYGTYEKHFGPMYRLHDFQFSRIQAATTARLLEKRLNLSATSLKLFYECPFHFLLDSVLRISPKETTLSIYFGNLTHEMMESLFQNEDFDIDKTVANSKAEFPGKETYKRKAYISFFQNQLNKIIPYLRRFTEMTSFREYDHEWQHSYSFPADSRFVVLGKIDRILTYDDNGKTYCAVIDYKTGRKTFSKEEFAAGIDIQLPFYLHLLANSPATSEMLPFGFYYQKVGLGRFAASNKEDVIAKLLQFEGMTLNDSVLISKFCGETWLKGVKSKADGGLQKSSRLLTDTEFADILTTMDHLIANAVAKISSGEYYIKPVAPKPNARISKSCEYCHHGAICNLMAIKRDQDLDEAGDEDE